MVVQAGEVHSSPSSASGQAVAAAPVHGAVPVLPLPQPAVVLSRPVAAAPASVETTTTALIMSAPTGLQKVQPPFSRWQE